MENNSKQLTVKMVLDSWNAQLQNVDKFLAAVSDEQLMKEVAPGRNRGIYLLGHLTAVNDRMIPLLNFGDQLYLVLNDPFLAKADKAVETIPTAAEIRKYWSDINAFLAAKFESSSAEDWFDKHTSVSPEDFAKEPHRNRLNVIISRTGHMAYHLGQLNFLK